MGGSHQAEGAAKGAGNAAVLGSHEMSRLVCRQEGSGGAVGSRLQMEMGPCGELGIQRVCEGGETIDKQAGR